MNVLNDPVDLLGMAEDPSVAAGLLAFAARYDELAPALVGTGSDLLDRAVGEAGEPADPSALRQALAPRLRSVGTLASALEALARLPLPPGDLLAAAKVAGRPAPAAGTWPERPGVEPVRAVLRRWAEGRPRVPNDRFDGELTLRDASVVRLVVTRVFRRVTEERLWTGDAPPPLGTYDGDLDGVARDRDDRGWGDDRWEGVRAGSVERRDCSACSGEGRQRCPRCNGGAFERCRQFEPCGACRSTGKAPRQQGRLLRAACPVCNGRGAVPCALCGGFGRRPCEGCSGGLIPCERCHAHGRVTQYDHGVIERWAETATEVDRARLERLGRDAERHFSTVTTLTRPRRVTGMPDALHDAVRRLLEPATPEQVRQRVRVDVLPAIEVTYADGEGTGTAWVLGQGDGVEVRAPGAASRPLRVLPRVPVAALVALAAVVAAVLAVVALRGGS